ncbi:MAG: Ig-like domain-containing protein [bacterium]|nr:Ig-like domain-containing protein [bacterium]
MYALLFIFVAACFVAGCKEENITQVVGPQDWQGPTVEWQSAMDAEVRGTVGLDVAVHDSSSILRVKLYVDGGENQTLTAPPYRFTVITDSLGDGVHLCEARAWDHYENLGISPVLRVNVANSIAQGPRVLWVPDSLATIQAAINAAQDFDTIRVSDGTYQEILNTFGKGIWLESEHGPQFCAINGSDSYNTLAIASGPRSCTVRGFHLTGAEIVVGLGDDCLADIFNNVMSSDTTKTGLIRSDYAGGLVHNNLFEGGQVGVDLGYTWGSSYNNIIRNCSRYGQWNAALYTNPLEYGYNLFWQNGSNYFNFEPGIGDVYGDPMLDLANGTLLPGSPALHAGNPEILNIDGSRSDIGPFGGPWAYTM